MAKFLNTSGINYYLEEVIKGTREQLYIISPFLRFNSRIKELLADVDRMKIDTRLVYGKSELAPQEQEWLRSLEFLRTSFCRNLHAKCYMNENTAIVSSMNLYEFSQVNNHEMGILIDRSADGALYKDVKEEASRLFRIGEMVGLAGENLVEQRPETVGETVEEGYEKLTTSKLAKSLGMTKADLTQRLVEKGLLVLEDEREKLSETAKAAGAELRFYKGGPYVLWPKGLDL